MNSRKLPTPSNRGTHSFFKPVFVFRVGACLSRSWSVFVRNWFLYASICTLTYGPSDLIEYMAIDGVFGSMLKEFVQTTTGENLLEFPTYFLGVVGEALVATLVFSQLENTPVTFITAYRRLLNVLGTVFIYAIISFLVEQFSEPTHLLSSVIYFMFFALALPAICIEGTSPITALRRSFSLTAGNRFSLMFIFILLIASVIGVFVIAHQIGLEIGRQPIGLIYFNPFNWVFGAVFGTAYSVLAATAYHDIRAVKEGHQQTDIAGVFD
jgi:hypothetical protein